MRGRFTKRYVGKHTEKGYEFAFFCDICGKPYRAPPVADADTAVKWWQSGRGQAFKKAAYNAQLRFNRCARCRKWVCDDDFDMDTGMCKHCAEEA